MAKTVSESELQYEVVKKYFLRRDEQEFVIRFSGTDMKDWELIPTATIDDMIEIRGQLCDERSDFAGFVYDGGRYSFYFRDQNILKVEFLDKSEIAYFRVHAVCEFDLAAIARELRMLQGS
jgi:hypothetical protein